MKGIRIILLFVFLPLAARLARGGLEQDDSEASTCVSSSPSACNYVVTVCLAAPPDGSTLVGAAPVSATAAVTGASPGVQRMIFSLNGAYLLNASTILQSVDATVRAFCDGSAQSDDMTAIVIKRIAPANVGRRESALVSSSQPDSDRALSSSRKRPATDRF